MSLSSFISKQTESTVLGWETEFNVKVIVTSPSQSRLGVFIPKRFGKHVIRINNNRSLTT